MNGPHDTSPPRLRQIAEDLSAEGWHTIAGTIWQVADEKEQCMSLTKERDALRGTLQNVLIHTALPPYPSQELLLGLIASIRRIAKD